MRAAITHRALALAATCTLLVGCAAGGVDGPDVAGDGAPGPETGAIAGEVVVFAAASLTDAFAELGEAFTAENPAVEVLFNHAGSQTLARQIDEGAPADVFASANTTQMTQVAEGEGLAGEPQVFTTNRLALAVEPGNPLGVGGLADLAADGLVLVLPAEEVPAGQYAREALEAAGVAVTPSSLEQDVRAALSKVVLGEADAAIVYASDLASAGDRIQGVAIPDRQNPPAMYPIGVLATAPNADAAEAFVAFVLGPAGQAILAAHGFGDG